MIVSNEMICTVPSIKHSSTRANYRRAVALCVDDAFLPYASFVASQLLQKEHNRDYDIVICMPHTSTTPTHFDSRIRYCAIDYSLLPKLPVGRLSMATYYKLFLPAIFANEYDQILYLDADVYILNAQISELMDKHQHHFPIAMAIDIAEIERGSGLNFHNDYLNQYREINHIYRNAGVILFNTQELLSINYLNQLFDFMNNLESKLTKHDQTLINTVLHDKIGSLSFLNNYQLIDKTIMLVNDFKPNIIHFVGELKPWNVQEGYVGSFYKEYKDFIEQYFPKNPIIAKSEFQVKYESRKKRRKYKNPFRENISLATFVGKEKLKHLVAKFSIQSEFQIEKHTKIRLLLLRFKRTIKNAIGQYELEMVNR